MSSSNKKRPPRIVFAFVTLLAAALFYAGAYLYTKSVQPTEPVAREADVMTAQEQQQTDSTQTQQAQSAATGNETKAANSEAGSIKSSDNLQDSQTSKKADSSASAKAEAEKAAKAETEKAAKAEAAKKKAEDEAARKNAAEKPREVRHKLEGTTADKVEKSDVYGALTQAIGSFEDRDYTVAFALYDLNTGATLTYNGKEELYPASSIKAPFTTSVYQELVDKGEVDLDEVAPVAQETIIESSDEGYRALHEAYGEQAFITWLMDAGVEPGSYGSYEDMVAWNYPHICAEQFCLMWRRIYAYLNTNTKAAKQLGEFLESRTVSSLRRALDKNTRSQSKMGWFETESDYNSMPATVEGGVVYSKQGPYVIIVMTGAPALLDDMVPLEQAITAARAVM